MQQLAQHVNAKYPRRPEVVALLKAEKKKASLMGVWLRKVSMHMPARTRHLVGKIVIRAV